jgi:hypothetical protein
MVMVAESPERKSIEQYKKGRTCSAKTTDFTGDASLKNCRTWGTALHTALETVEMSLNFFLSRRAIPDNSTSGVLHPKAFFQCIFLHHSCSKVHL